VTSRLAEDLLIGVRTLRVRQEPPALAQFVEESTRLTLEGWQRTICDRLQGLLSQHGQRLLIHGPPQHGKSILISQRFPAWALGIRPDLRLRIACYNVSHAERFTRVVLSLMRDASFTAMFPDAGARVPAVCPGDEWSTLARAGMRDANPSMKALGLGTGFTGLGVDTLIVDDPYKDAQEARSDATNTMLWDWWQQVVMPRLNPDTNIVVMFHRWWEGDLAGRLLAQGGWELLRFPAIADGLPGDPTMRPIGTALSPRYPLAHLLEIKQGQGTAFEALYQGIPYPTEGGLFRAGKVTFTDVVPAGCRFVRRWDIAASEGRGDYSAGVLLAAVATGTYVVADVVRGQWGPDTRNAILRETAERDRSYGAVQQVVPQDPGAAGVDMAQALVRLLAGFTVSAERESGDKVTRADPFAAQWNAGNVSLLRDSDERRWNAAYLAECERFPNGAHDDMVDASSGAFNKLTARRVMTWA
jgi:predicted phage terminase large subunit-like protein